MLQLFSICVFLKNFLSSSHTWVGLAHASTGLLWCSWASGSAFASDFLSQPAPRSPPTPNHCSSLFFGKKSSGPVRSCFHSASQVETGSEPQPAVPLGARWGCWADCVPIAILSSLPHVMWGALDYLHLTIQPSRLLIVHIQEIKETMSHLTHAVLFLFHGSKETEAPSASGIPNRHHQS